MDYGGSTAGAATVGGAAGAGAVGVGSGALPVTGLALGCLLALAVLLLVLGFVALRSATGHRFRNGS